MLGIFHINSSDSGMHRKYRNDRVTLGAWAHSGLKTWAQVREVDMTWPWCTNARTIEPH